MDILLLLLVAFGASVLTFYSGFGLGTLLMPVFSLFVPVDIAIIMTAVVHFLNTVFKLLLTWKDVHWKTWSRFGLTSFIFSGLGAIGLIYFGSIDQTYSYRLFEFTIHTRLINVLIGLLLVTFTMVEFLDKLKIKSDRRFVLEIGGMISGFFGGLSGHQGALRSAFLSNINLTKQQFISTGIACALLVDLGRLSIYCSIENQTLLAMELRLIVPAILAAWAGAWMGNKYLKKITQTQIQLIVCICLVVYGVFLAMGFV